MGMDHRWGKRQSTNVEVHVFAPSGKTGKGRVINVSLTGAYLETHVPLYPHSLVYLRSPSQDIAASDAIHIAANVVRFGAHGFGLEWCEALSKGAQIDALLAFLKNGDINNGASAETTGHAMHFVGPGSSQGAEARNPL
jgi:hypothetical protein